MFRGILWGFLPLYPRTARKESNPCNIQFQISADCFQHVDHGHLRCCLYFGTLKVEGKGGSSNMSYSLNSLKGVI